MKTRLQYIPTERELRRARDEVLRKEEEVEIVSPEPIDEDELDPKHELLSKEELTLLLDRLVPDRRKLHPAKLQAIADQNKKALKEARRNAGDKPVEEKLIQMGKQLKQRKQEMAKAKEAEQLTELRDRPQVSHNVVVQQKPIKDRYKQVLIDKQVHLKEVVKQHCPTFAPEINSYSKFIAEIRNENDPNVVNRLLNEGEKIDKKTLQLGNQINQALSSQNTFQPKINHNTSALLRNNPLFREGLPVQQRAQIIQSRVRREKQSKPTAQYSFQPVICPASNALANTNQPVGDRLYRQAQQLARKKVERAESANDRYSFQPKVNRTRYQSSCIESEESFVEEEDYYQVQQCLKTYDDTSTIQKTRNKSMRSSNIESRYLQSSRSRPSHHAQSEMQQCTFKPALHKPIRSTTTLSNIYGLENHLKNCDKARLLRLAQQSSEQKLRLP